MESRVSGRHVRPNTKYLDDDPLSQTIYNLHQALGKAPPSDNKSRKRHRDESDSDIASSSKKHRVYPPTDIDDRSSIDSSSILTDQITQRCIQSGRMKTTGGNLDDVTVDPSELVSLKKFSGHMLWFRVQKQKLVDRLGGDFEDINYDQRKFRQLWSFLSNNEKEMWNKRARKLMKDAEKVNKKAEANEAKQQKLAAIPSADLRNRERRRIQSQLERMRINKFTCVDLAAHFQLLGDSMHALSLKLGRVNNHVSVAGTVSVLMDAMLCSLITLTSLTSQVPGISDAVEHGLMADSLDNCAYFLPGMAAQQQNAYDAA